MVGSFLDPLADKVLIGCTAGALVYQGTLPYWAAMPIVARDLCLVFGTVIHFTFLAETKTTSVYQHLFRLQKGIRQGYHVKPSFVSKVNTALQLVLVASCMGHGWTQCFSFRYIDVLAKLTVATTLTSWGLYAWEYFYRKRGFI